MAPTPKKKAAKIVANRVEKSATVPVRVARNEAPQFGDGFVAISVGNSLELTEATFAVHRSLIATKSDYFRAALNWPGFSGRITVADIDGEDFKVFVQWIYTDRIYTQLSEQTTVEVQDDGDTEDNEWETLIDLYIMGDRLVAPAFKDAIINSIIEKEMETGRMPLAVQQVYENTKPNCPLRRLIVDFHVYGYREETLAANNAKDFIGDAPKEFYQDVMAVMVRAGAELYKKKISPWVENPTAYHEPRYIDLSRSP